MALRVMPAGCIFADKGPAAFVANDDCRQLLSLLAIANAASFRALVDLQMAFGSFEVGVIQRTPVPNLSESDESVLATLARRAWSLKRSLDTANETSHAFALPALLQAEGDSLADRVVGWTERVRAVDAEIADIQAEIDEPSFDLYGIDEHDRRAITEGFGTTTGEDSDSSDDTDDEVDSTAPPADAAALIAELVSWAVGVALGRFDLHLATDERTLPSEPEPFDRLPACSPGMLSADNGPPLTREDESRQRAEGGWRYQIAITWNGVLVDDPGHLLDIERRIRNVIEVIWKDRAESVTQEACELLGAKSLREYFRKPAGFFADHLKRYSKSRRQAPIYWPLSTASGSYTIWIYYQRLTDQTLYACVNGFVQPKLNDLEREIPRLRDEKRTRDLQAVVALQSEVEEFKQELLAWAPRWKPNLNDGVLITACPLWKLFRLPKWRKDLEACWKKLEAGEYDWAHLAYTLWPDRVREKCKKDRSLAIAHGLEEICEVEPPKPKKAKKARRVKERVGQMELEAGERTQE